MQVSGSGSPEGEGLSDRPSAAQSWASEEAFPDTTVAADADAGLTDDGGTAQSKAPVNRRPVRAKDPVAQWLTLAIALVVVFFLVGVLSAMMFGLLSPSPVPRTSVERDLMTMTAAVEGGKANSETYAQYVGVLISAGQLNKAQQSLERALKTAKTGRSYLYAQQAQLLMVQKDYKGAAKVAGQAMAEAEAELKAFQDENVKNNRKANAGTGMPKSYSTAALIEAEALVASKDFAGAVKAFDLYITKQPTDSDVLVQRALAKIEVADKKGAEADFREALKYIPDYQPALDGLKQIGAAQ